jgi:short-subunit dehydrogenase
MEKKVILLTGASSGLGKIAAEYLAKKGHMVIGTSRQAPLPEQILLSSKTEYPLLIQMDVTDETSIKRVISFIKKHFDRIDIIVNNAGWGISGPIEETSLQHAQTLFNTNFFGMLSVTQCVLPLMRSQKQGLIINISSIGGVLGLPYQGLYSASKFAVEGLTESLRLEVKKFGINVSMVEPGDFKTGFTKNRKKTLFTSSPYTDSVNNTTSVFEKDEQNGSDPLNFAQLIDNIINSNNPKLRYRVGSFSQKFIARLKGVIPDRIVQWILMKYYGL